MKCDKCGFESENAIFCPNCGNKLEIIDKSTKEIEISDELSSTNNETDKNDIKEDTNNKEIPKNNIDDKKIDIKEINDTYIICNICGFKNKIDDSFCSNCGNNLKESFFNKHTPKPHKHKFKLNKKSKIILCITTFIIVLCLIATLFFSFKFINEKSTSYEILDGMNISIPNTWDVEIEKGELIKCKKDNGDFLCFYIYVSGINISKDEFKSDCDMYFISNPYYNPSIVDNRDFSYITDNIFKMKYSNEDGTFNDDGAFIEEFYTAGKLYSLYAYYFYNENSHLYYFIEIRSNENAKDSIKDKDINNIIKSIKPKE